MDKVKIPKRAIFAVLFLCVLFISPLWFSAPYEHTEKVILQESYQIEDGFNSFSFLIDGIEQDKVSVHYGVTSKKKTRDWLFKVETEDVFNDEWYLMVTDDTLTLSTIKVDSLRLRIDDKVYDINVDNTNHTEGYEVLAQSLNFKKPSIIGTDYNEVSMILLPLPAIPEQTFDLMMTGVVKDIDNNEEAFSYTGHGVVTIRKHKWQRSSTLLPSV